MDCGAASLTCQYIEWSLALSTLRNGKIRDYNRLAVANSTRFNARSLRRTRPGGSSTVLRAAIPHDYPGLPITTSRKTNSASA